MHRAVNPDDIARLEFKANVRQRLAPVSAQHPKMEQGGASECPRGVSAQYAKIDSASDARSSDTDGMGILNDTKQHGHSENPKNQELSSQ